MRNQLLILVLALLTFTACKQAETNQETADTEPAATEESVDHTATFNDRIAVLRAFTKAHSDEDLEAQRSMLADTLQWSSARYSENPWAGKDAYVEALKGYHDNFDDITYTEGIVLPNDTASGFFSGNHYATDGTVNSGANAIRCYGTWHATHTATGKKIGAKWFAVISFNDDNKIAMVTDYWNVDGLAAQLAEE